MSRADFRRRRSRRRKQKSAWMSRHLPTFILLLAITVSVGGGIFIPYRLVLAKQPDGTVQVITPSEQNGFPNPDGNSPSAGGASGGNFGGSSGNSSSEASGDSSSGPPGQPSAEAPQDDISRLIIQADCIAMGYDYGKTVEPINPSGLDLEDSHMEEVLAQYESQKAALVPADMNAVTHIFFYSLTIDTPRAFNGDSDSTNYDSIMTIKDESLKILKDMYQKGYASVRTHSVAYEVPGKNGNVRFVEGNVMLPEGKKPFAMSQDDVCYYPCMDGDGSAKRVVIGEGGKSTCGMVMDDSTISTGSYDLIPLLEGSIQEHPDFSYKGTRAIIAFTGYEDILGYRIASSYQNSPTHEADHEQAARATQRLKDNGWELASHSRGRPHLGAVGGSQTGLATDEERFRTDTDKWEAEVESLIGPTDIILYPYGNDIANWRPYHQDNPHFAYLESKGFRYFCNVDVSKPYWTQMGTNYFHMARRNLNDYCLYEDFTQTSPARKRLTDLFDAAQVFDPARPTSVSWSYQK